MLLLETPLALDTRDDEVAPAHGGHHVVGVRLSPWQTDELPYRYANLSANLRWYVRRSGPSGSSWRRGWWATSCWATAPVYELSRFEETSALGGAKFVRGVPTNRYYGKRKVVGNLELRSRLARFRVGRSQYEVGLTGFVDGGRVWADLLPRPDLDGTALSLKYGVGGGLRLQKGETFVLRADVAWSPDARPIGAYLLAGHQF